MALQVALVDDEQVARTYIRRLPLWREGEFELALSVASASELLHALEKQMVDIVLLDVFMPEMDGVQLSRVLAEKYPQIDLVAISNFDGYDYVRPMMKMGAQDYLLKSRLTGENLREVLRRIRENRANAAQEEAPFREQLRRFLAGDAPWPFPLDGSQPVSCFCRVTDDALGDPERLAQRQHALEELLEQENEPGVRCTAAAYAENRLLLILRFDAQPSVAALQKQAGYLMAKKADSAEAAFHLHVEMELGPVMSNVSALPPYILDRVRRQKEKTETEGRTGQLPLTEVRRVLALLEEGDRKGLAEAIADIMHPQDEQDVRARLFLARALVELARSAAQEMKADFSLPPEGNALFIWMQGKPYPELVAQVQSIFDRMAETKTGEKQKVYSEPVRQAMRFLDEHYAENVRLTAAARVAKVNESYLSRLFRKETGQTLGDYLTEKRMYHARALLLQGQPAKAVAAQVGYVQYTHFLRVFKQNEGKTVKQFLQDVKNG